MIIRTTFYFLLILLLAACAATKDAHQPQSIELKLAGGASVPIKIWPVGRSQRLLWLSSDKGFPAGMNLLAERLQRNKFEVWQADLLAAEFLPSLASSMEKVSEKTLLDLLEQVLDKDDRELILMADGHGAKLLTRAARVWRNQHDGQWPKQITTVVLVSPNLYESTPQPGEEAKYIDSSGELGGRLILFQPQLSPYRWWIERTVNKLKTKAGSVDVKSLTGVRDRFYFRPDANKAEQKMEQQFVKLVVQAIRTSKR